MTSSSCWMSVFYLLFTFAQHRQLTNICSELFWASLQTQPMWRPLAKHSELWHKRWKVDGARMETNIYSEVNNNEYHELILKILALWIENVVLTKLQRLFYMYSCWTIFTFHLNIQCHIHIVNYPYYLSIDRNALFSFSIKNWSFIK